MAATTREEAMKAVEAIFERCVCCFFVGYVFCNCIDFLLSLVSAQLVYSESYSSELWSSNTFLKYSFTIIS